MYQHSDPKVIANTKLRARLEAEAGEDDWKEDLTPEEIAEVEAIRERNKRWYEEGKLPVGTGMPRNDSLSNFQDRKLPESAGGPSKNIFAYIQKRKILRNVLRGEAPSMVAASFRCGSSLVQ